MINYIESDAVLSDCKRYRYLLRRVWDYDGVRALFVMLNPSTADASVDDATIRSCTRLCSSQKFGSFEVVNLFAYRATDPDELLECDDPVGLINENVTRAAANRCDLVICAWGSHVMGMTRKSETFRILKDRKIPIYCFGKNKDGSPKHPLYLRSETALVPYDA